MVGDVAPPSARGRVNNNEPFRPIHHSRHGLHATRDGACPRGVGRTPCDGKKHQRCVDAFPITRTAGNLILMMLILRRDRDRGHGRAASISGGIITPNAWLVVRSMELSIPLF